MGLFSTKKTVNVVSSVYNMAGDEANRADYMKSTIFASTLNPYGGFLGEKLVQSYLGGPGINQRLLFKYAVRTAYPGLPEYSISQALIVDPEVVRPYIDVPVSPAGQVVEIQTVTLANGDYEVFAEKYMNENFPAEINTNWVAEYYVYDHSITIQRAGGGTVNFPAGIYDPFGRFIVANYYCHIPEDVQALVAGTLNVAVTSGLPDNTGFTLTSTTNTGVVTYNYDQTRVITKVYSDGSPTTQTTDYPSNSTNFNTILTVHEKEEYLGGDGISTERTNRTTFNRLWEYRQVYASSTSEVVVNDMGGGHTETVTTDITGDFLRTVYDWQVDTQDTIFSNIIGGNKVFIYKIGTGNAVLDALNAGIGSVVTAEFFPVVPVRLDNVSIMDPIHIDLYEKSRLLYKRATRNQKLDELVAEVENNISIGDIDYAYVQWAISLNTKDNEALKYIYNFWKNLISIHGLPLNYMDDFENSAIAYEANVVLLDQWTVAQGNPIDPLYGTARPSIPSFGEPKTTTLDFRINHALFNSFDNRISFSFIDENTFTGLGKIGAKVGELWIEQRDAIVWDVAKGVFSTDGSQASTLTNTMGVFSIFWQTGINEHKIIRVFGAVHENYIYGGKAVIITSDDALIDLKESGFLIPLHYPSIIDAGLVSSTQLATANTYIIFNCYEVVEQEWYQSFLGMLFITIAIVATAALISPALVGSVSGIFGVNSVVGTTFGLTGTSAVVAGAVTNALAAILITTALTEVSTSLFGEKWGALIGSLVSFAISFGMAGGFNNLSTMFQPANILALSSSLANGYQGFVQGSIAEMNEQLFTIGEEYESEMNRIEQLMADLIGNDLAFDPMSLTDAIKGNGTQTGSYLPESLDDFIQRTTLTGSDIVDMTLSLINDFADLSLTLPEP